MNYEHKKLMNSAYHGILSVAAYVDSVHNQGIHETVKAMMTSKFSFLNRLLRTPLHAAIVATGVSLLFATLINLIFLTPAALPMTLLITFIISAPMSYLTIKIVLDMRSTIETQRFNLAIEHERSEILSRFIRDAAHEFKTPLTLMETSLYLTEKATDPDKKHVYSQRVHEQIQTLNNLIETILILTRLDSVNKWNYPRTIVKSPELRSDIQAFTSIPRVKIQIDHPEMLPSVRLNVPDFHLAIKQIIDNGLRYAPDAGDLILQVSSATNHIKLSVIDHGMGMNPETITHCFERFYRGDTSHTTRGLGLGLAIAKQVVELHNGTIEIQSELGKGTTVSVNIPAP